MEPFVVNFASNIIKIPIRHKAKLNKFNSKLQNRQKLEKRYINNWFNTRLNITKNCLKGHGNEAHFLGFCRNWVLIDLLHYLSSRSAFGFEFAEIFESKNDAPTRRVGESATLRLGKSGSR